MFYDRKVRYLDDMIGGERRKGAGFVKAEVRDDLCRMQVHVSGLYSTDSFEKTVILIGAEKESVLCRLTITGGKADSGELCLDSRRLGDKRLAYEELEEIRIPIASGRELRCLWKEAGDSRCSRKPERELISAEKPERRTYKAFAEESERRMDKAFAEESERRTDKAFAEESERRTDMVFAEEAERQTDKAFVEEAKRRTDVIYAEEMERRKDKIFAEEAERRTDKASAEKSGKEPQPEKQRLFPLEDKWKQLSAIYPHVFPFQDRREYLSLGPGDFVIFPAAYYRLVNNSFLLHGYHNYEHLILTRMEHRGEIRYYIGVPGNYYEKEKQVAIMFGFESFECRTEPAQPGDYGYYMMRVEL